MNTTPPPKFLLSALEPFDGHPDSRWPHVMPRPEARITALYLILASIWVILTDFAVFHILPGRPFSACTMKGLNFVVTTSLLLFFVLRRAYRGWRRAERKQWQLMSDASDSFRALSARAEQQRETDRTRISRELHDRLGQSLTALSLELRLIESQLEQRDDAALNPLTDRLVETQEQVANMAVTVQHIASDLRPDALDSLGLEEAIRQEIESFTRLSGIPCEFQGTGMTREIPDPVITAAFRILQEALTNVIRHAEASRVRVTCEVKQHLFKITLADNGKGLPPDVTFDGKSLGLLGMRERAEHLGGHLEITPGETGGTLVTALLPCQTHP
jgi:signal transduction histidine kinase